MRTAPWWMMDPAASGGYQKGMLASRGNVLLVKKTWVSFLFLRQSANIFRNNDNNRNLINKGDSKDRLNIEVGSTAACLDFDSGREVEQEGKYHRQAF